MTQSIPSINKLTGYVSRGDGFAQGNLFAVILPRWEEAGLGAEELSLLTSSVSLPSRQVTTITRELGLDKRQVASAYVNPPVQMTFRIMNDQRIRKYFEVWQQRIVPNSGSPDVVSKAVNYYDYYVRPVKILHLRKEFNTPLFERQFNLPLPGFIKNRLRSVGPLNFDLLGGLLDLDVGVDGVSLDLDMTGSTGYETTLYDAYPTSIVPSELSDNNGNSLSTISVEFAYRTWKGFNVSDNNPINKIKREIDAGLHEIRDGIEDKVTDFVKKQFT